MIDADALGALTHRVLDFWFGPVDTEGRYARQATWFRADPAFDSACNAAFGQETARAAVGELDGLTATREGSLALVLLLDQFPRNIYRGQAQAFSADAKAREVARKSLARGDDQLLSKRQRLFLYLPFEHSEDLTDQELAVRLVATLGDLEQLRWAERHRDLIARFGRFPHRNAILGRVSTPEEAAFLKRPGSSF
jgi:uncharacterized protein (DUF924 family)